MLTDLNQEIIQGRLEQLFLVLKYDRNVLCELTVWERMQINQERGSLYDCERYYNGDEIEPRTIEVPENIEFKIQNIVQDEGFGEWVLYHQDDSLE